MCGGCEGRVSWSRRFWRGGLGAHRQSTEVGFLACLFAWDCGCLATAVVRGEGGWRGRGGERRGSREGGRIVVGGRRGEEAGLLGSCVSITLSVSQIPLSCTTPSRTLFSVTPLALGLGLVARPRRRTLPPTTLLLLQTALRAKGLKMRLVCGLVMRGDESIRTASSKVRGGSASAVASVGASRVPCTMQGASSPISFWAATTTSAPNLHSHKA